MTSPGAPLRGVWDTDIFPGKKCPLKSTIFLRGDFSVQIHLAQLCPMEDQLPPAPGAAGSSFPSYNSQNTKLAMVLS